MPRVSCVTALVCITFCHATLVLRNQKVSFEFSTEGGFNLKKLYNREGCSTDDCTGITVLEQAGTGDNDCFLSAETYLIINSKTVPNIFVLCDVAPIVTSFEEPSYELAILKFVGVKVNGRASFNVTLEVLLCRNCTTLGINIEVIPIDDSHTKAKVKSFSLRFKEIAIINEKTQFVAPYASGEIKDAEFRDRESKYEYPQVHGTYQFVAVYTPNNQCARKSCGLYVASNDPFGAMKSLSYLGYGQDDIVLKVIARRRSPEEFYFEFGTFSGDWYDASQIYRRWALRAASWTGPVETNRTLRLINVQTSATPIRTSSMLKTRIERGELDQSFVESAFWLNTGWQERNVFRSDQGDPGKVLRRMKQLRATLNDKEFNGMNLHWYEWIKDYRFDRGYPHYFPARDGFAFAVNELQSKGIRVFPYINGRLFDQSTPEWKAHKAEAYAVRNEYGEIDVHSYGTYVMSTICPSTEYWQQMIASTCHRLATEYNVFGVYIDQIGSMEAVECSSSSHGHTPNDGLYWTAGYRKMLEAIQERHSGVNGRALHIVTEDNAEPYMDLLAAYLSLQAFTKWSVPVFSAIYNGYTILFGSLFDPSEVTGSLHSLYFKIHISRQLHLMQTIGWMSLDDDQDMFKPLTESSDAISYLQNAVAWRSSWKEYFVYGRLVRNVNISHKFNEQVGWRAPMYGYTRGYPIQSSVLMAGPLPGETFNPLYLNDELMMAAPAVPFSHVVILSNALPSDQNVTFVMPLTDYALQNAALVISEGFTDGSARFVTALRQNCSNVDLSFSVTMKYSSFRLFIFTPSTVTPSLGAEVTCRNTTLFL